MVELDLTRPNDCLEVGGSGVKNKSFLLWEAAAGEAVRTVVQCPAPGPRSSGILVSMLTWTCY